MTLETICNDSAGLFCNEDEYVLIENCDIMFSNAMVQIIIELFRVVVVVVVVVVVFSSSKNWING